MVWLNWTWRVNKMTPSGLISGLYSQLRNCVFDSLVSHELDFIISDPEVSSLKKQRKRRRPQWVSAYTWALVMPCSNFMGHMIWHHKWKPHNHYPCLDLVWRPECQDQHGINRIIFSDSIHRIRVCTLVIPSHFWSRMSKYVLSTVRQNA